ncbi:MAG: hydrogenase nickel incorporation protein HypB [Hyphomicrobium sp.]
MCATCGCSDGAKATIHNLATGLTKEIMHDLGAIGIALHRHGHSHSHSHGGVDHAHPHDHEHAHAHEGHDHTHEHMHGDGHDHDHAHSHGHDHHHDHGHSRGIVDLQHAILEKNDALAARNRAWLEGREALMLNVVSSPGAGKTALLERTIRDLVGKHAISVIEGDQATANDGARIVAAGAPAVQVNTGTGCHLEADMVKRGLDELNPRPGSIVFVENVGNLVCPALFDLGEKGKIAILSVTEGEDKPLKYPHMFRAASLLLLNKVDLLPHLDFEVGKVVANAREVNPDVAVLQVSAKTGEGMTAWYAWLDAQIAEVRT